MTSVDLCPVDHAAIKLDVSVWERAKARGKAYVPPAPGELGFVGSMPTYDDPGQPQELELANCSCGTTLCRAVR